MKKNKHQSPESRKQQILLAAEIVLLKEGIEKFTIDQVILHAQIAKGTVYKYYKSRDHLLSEMSVKAVVMLFSSFKSAVVGRNSSLEKIRAVIHACYHFYKLYPQYYGLLNYFERTDVNPTEKSEYLKVSTSLQEFVEIILHEGKIQGEISIEITPVYLDYIIWSSCVGLIQFIETKKDLIPNFHDINQERLIDDLATVLIRGMKG
jgi:AcrR family transcriptional regulator